MKNIFGNNISISLFGESHGNKIGVVIDGFTPGITIKNEDIRKALLKRRPQNCTETARCEPDIFEIISGVFNEKTTGTPICILIQNNEFNSDEYKYGVARPSQVDYSAFCKYHGFEDFRGGGHFSGRITAPIVAAGAIFLNVLESIGIEIGTHIFTIGNEHDKEFVDIYSELPLLKNKIFPVLEPVVEEKMRLEIIKAKNSHDSIGGTTETAIIGLPSGLGEPWFDSVESMLSHAIFSIGGIKGIEFGEGFAFSKMNGSEANDEFAIVNDNIVTKTNHNGGINGGITNGMPVIFRCAIKPTPSIAKEQQTVDFIKKKSIDISIKGRHDPSIVRRICPVIDAITAFVFCDMLAGRYGTDVFLRGIEK